MADFADILTELREGLDDPERFHTRLSLSLDPNVLDRLAGFGAARGETSARTVLLALEWFMFSAAEQLWQELSSGVDDPELARDSALSLVIERYLSSAMGEPGQGLIEGATAAEPRGGFQRGS